MAIMLGRRRARTPGRHRTGTKLTPDESQSLEDARRVLAALANYPDVRIEPDVWAELEALAGEICAALDRVAAL